MTIGSLVHITAAKKLMIKINEKTFMTIHSRLTAECKKKNFSTERLAVYSRENDDGEEDFFAMVSLDKYDKLNMPKFERLLRKDINFQTKLKSYDFIPDGKDEQVCGINLELTTIRQIKPITLVTKEKEQTGAQQQIAADEEELRLLQGKKALPEEQKCRMDQLENEVRERSYEHLEIPDPPVLERQNAVRRRRTATGMPVATDVLAEIKKLEDLIAANELAIGADE